jgi:hypothetical protein
MVALIEKETVDCMLEVFAVVMTAIAKNGEEEDTTPGTEGGRKASQGTGLSLTDLEHCRTLYSLLCERSNPQQTASTGKPMAQATQVFTEGPSHREQMALQRIQRALRSFS